MSINPQTITIYSVGLMGGSLGLALKTSGFSGKIVGVSSGESIKTALVLGCIDEGYGYDRLADVAAKSDILFLCSPIGVIIETLELLGTLPLPEGLIISDVGSTKQVIVSTAQRALPPHVRFIGGHPMAGSEKTGAAAADPYLFQNAIYVLTKNKNEPDTADRDFAAFLQRYLGCTPAFLSPDIHDTIVATVSHVPHLLAVALVNLAGEINGTLPGTLELAAGGFRDMTRIAAAPFRLWKSILQTNKKSIAPILDQYISLLNETKNELQGDALAGTFERASATRAKIASGNKGFIHPLSEILVHAKDQPGQIASLANALAAVGININDIEVLKVREGEGGTIRLAFESPEVSKKASGVLRRHGFTTRERE